MILNKNHNSIIQYIDNICENDIYIKRDDLIPYSFGGNKARKAILFFEDIKRQNSDCIVTYGSKSSNHCRVISNFAVAVGLDCFLISPDDFSKSTNNGRFMNMFGAEIIYCNVENVAETIDLKLKELKAQNRNPYFIPGGGHGNIGTRAYVDCYNEIIQYEKENNTKFEYIFHATGTGTTQSGLVCGSIINGDNRNIVGISIARKKPYGKNVVVSSVCDYLNLINFDYEQETVEKSVIFDDSYIGKGYGDYNETIKDIVKKAMIEYSVPLDTTYTGKAFAGMIDFINKNNIKNQNILFLHTGGLPIFFDSLGEWY